MALLASGLEDMSAQFPITTTPLVSGWEDMEHVLDGDEFLVMYRLYHGDRSSSLQECFRPVPKAQPRSLHDIGLPLQLHPEGTYQVPQAAHMAPSPVPDHPDERGRDFCGSIEGDP